MGYTGSEPCRANEKEKVNITMLCLTQARIQRSLIKKFRLIADAGRSEGVRQGQVPIIRIIGREV
jgi:hypothetical protein